MHNYYQILGLNDTASLAQIKRAYRYKAKLYHPDVYKAPDAHEKFMLVNEAYAYLIKMKGLKAGKQNEASKQTDIEAFGNQWQAEERRKAQERAQAYAHMRYEAYLKSDLYRTTEAVNSIVDFFATGFIILFVVVLPVLLYHKYGAPALIIAAVIILPTAPLWFRFLIKTFDKGAFLSFFTLHHPSIKSKVMRLLIFTILNGLVFFRITLNSLLELHWILVLYILIIALSFIPKIKTASRYKKHLFHFIIAPAVINLFFLTNYTFSHSPKKEAYTYTYTLRNSTNMFTSIYLDQNHYAQYQGMRFFLNFERFINHNKINYTISNGLFGIKVVNDINISNTIVETNQKR